MKIYRSLIIWTFIIGIFSIAGLTILTCQMPEKQNNWIAYGQMLTSGVFASSLLLLVNAIIGYRIERKKDIVNFCSLVTLLYDSQGNMEFCYKESGATELENEQNVYMWLANMLHNLSGEMLQTRLDIKLLFAHTKLQKDYKYINDLIIKLAEDVALFKMELYDARNNVYKVQQLYDQYLKKIGDNVKDVVKKTSAFRAAAGYGEDLVNKESK